MHGAPGVNSSDLHVKILWSYVFLEIYSRIFQHCSAVQYSAVQCSACLSDVTIACMSTGYEMVIYLLFLTLHHLLPGNI
jgi:hypothetical protein